MNATHIVHVFVLCGGNKGLGISVAFMVLALCLWLHWLETAGARSGIETEEGTEPQKENNGRIEYITKLSAAAGSRGARASLKITAFANENL